MSLVARVNPMATVAIPALLRRFTGGVDRATVDAVNVREVVDELERLFPGIRGHLVGEDNELSGSVAVWIDGEIASGGMLDAVKPTSEVHFLPAIGGG
jgi:molybdopterin synthase sulfur carrier subunit